MFKCYYLFLLMVAFLNSPYYILRTGIIVGIVFVISVCWRFLIFFWERFTNANGKKGSFSYLIIPLQLMIREKQLPLANLVLRREKRFC